MYYVTAKSLWFLAQPSSLFLSLLVGGLALASFTAWARAGRRLAWGGLALLLIGGFSPLANFLILPLESRFPNPNSKLPDGPIAGIILLGGYEDGRITAGRRSLTLNEAAERLTEALLVARRLPDTKLIVSGGAVSGLREDTPGTAAVGAFLEANGIARDRIILEDKSLTTRENATLSAALLKPKPGQRYLLVTSAAHMPRAVGVFRQQGFDVIAWPADFRTKDGGDAVRFFENAANGLKRLDETTKEWVGLVAYRLLGYSDSLFPAP